MLQKEDMNLQKRKRDRKREKEQMLQNDKQATVRWREGTNFERIEEERERATRTRVNKVSDAFCVTLIHSRFGQGVMRLC